MHLEKPVDKDIFDLVVHNEKAQGNMDILFFAIQSLGAFCGTMSVSFPENWMDVAFDLALCWGTIGNRRSWPRM